MTQEELDKKIELTLAENQAAIEKAEDSVDGSVEKLPSAKLKRSGFSESYAKLLGAGSTGCANAERRSARRLRAKDPG